VKEGERSEPFFTKVPILLSLSFGYHVILIKVNTPPRGEATGKRSLSNTLKSKACEAYMKLLTNRRSFNLKGVHHGRHGEAVAKRSLCFRKPLVLTFVD